MRQKLGKVKSQQWQEILKPGHLTIPTTSALPLSSDNQTTLAPNNSPCVLHKWYWMTQFSSHSVSAARILLGVNHKFFYIRTCCLRDFEARSPGFNSWQLSTSHFPLFLLHNIKSYLSPAEARCFVTTTDIPIEALTWFTFTAHLHFQYCILSRCFWFCEYVQLSKLCQWTAMYMS